MKSDFGYYKGKSVTKYTLTNKNGTQASVLSLGGILQSFAIYHADGQLRNHVLRFDNISDYYENPYQINKQIGRVAGRIKNATVELENQQYQLTPNNGAHLLHGGDFGLNQVHFDVKVCGDNKLLLSTVCHSQVDGFPGDLVLEISYELLDNDCLVICYKAVAQNGATVFDPTLHVYWDLSAHLVSTQMKLASKAYVETDDENIPTGRLLPVDNSPFDFQTPTSVSEGLESLREEGQKQYDHAFVVSPSLETPIAEISDSEKDYKVKIYSDRNGLVIFTANPLDIDKDTAGVYQAIATEPQTLPDSLHHDDFGNIRLKAGQVIETQMVFKLETLKK